MKQTLRHGTVTLGLLVVSAAYGGDLPNYNAYSQARPAVSAAPSITGARLHGRVASTDAQRGVPTVLWADQYRTPRAPQRTPTLAAQWYLTQHASLYKLSRAALDTAYVHRVHDTGRGGIIVFFRQRINGIDVIRNELKVLMTRDLRLMAITGNLHDQATVQSVKGSASFQLGAADALARALGDLYGVSLSVGSISALNQHKAGYQYFDLAQSSAAAQAGIRLELPARVKPIYFPLPDRLVPAHFVELLASKSGAPDDQGYAYILAADSGQVLYRQNLEADDMYNYRVWADSTGLKTPLDGPQANYTPHPRGIPDGTEPAFVAPVMIPMEGFNTNPDGTVDPWLPAGATETTGNNVDAYADHVNPDGFTPDSDFRAAITGEGIFDYIYDTLLGPLDNQSQSKAAIVQLFYVNNWLHDYFYDSGFNEAAGNAQSDNFDRGGEGGDPLRAEAQDSAPNTGVRNNANMFTPADGVSPRMQMYLWNTPDIVRSLSTGSQDFATNTASFGPVNFSAGGRPVVADDGTEPRANGCEPLVNDVTDAIVLIDRGTCAFALKAKNAENAGAAGVIIINNAPGPAPSMGQSDPPTTVNIPTLSVSDTDGQALRNLAATGGVDLKMTREVGIERDGTIDNAIVAHEWGHYIHHRLVDCSATQCRGQSEGWGDFFALHMMVREGDNYEGTYAAAIYSTLVRGDNGYFGIRRAPYSRDMTKNALSFRHISNGVPLPTEHPLRPSPNPNAQVHNTGEVWASMLFDGYVSLLKQTQGPSPRYTFAEAKRRMADYVVAGMMLAPVDPTFTEQRDAILMAAMSRDMQDMLLLAQAFARRGAGSCAVSSETNSPDHAGVVEDFDIRADMRLGAILLDDSATSCDSDGVLDGEESGVLRLTIDNPTPVPLTGTSVSVSSSATNVAFPDGPSAILDDVAPFGTGTIDLPISILAGAKMPETIALEITVSNPATCKSTVTQVRVMRGNYDLAPSAIDSVDSHVPAWQETILGGFVGAVWAPVESPLDAQDRVWYGVDSATTGDATLQSAPIMVSADQDFVVSFEHRYKFESAPNQAGQMVHYDGAVIELSTDGGATWNDVSTYVDPGYGGTLNNSNNTPNPLAGRPAFVDQNAAWPEPELLTLNLGTQLAGQEVRLRFRIGTDRFSGEHGWEIDDIQVQGAANEPFWKLVPDTSTCVVGRLPTADAGANQVVNIGDTVTLNASLSADPDGDSLSFLWMQTGGPMVMLNGGDTASATFVAPAVDEDTVLTFEVKVSDGSGAATDTIEVTVLAPTAAPDAGPGSPDAGDGSGDDGCGCSVGTAQSSSSRWPLAFLFGLGLIVLRRRRNG